MLKSFSKAEKILFSCAYLIIILTFIFFKSGIYEFLTSILFLSGVMLNSKGIRYWFLFSGLGVLIYAYVAYNNRFYSEVIINIFYMIPIQIWGFIKWKKDKLKFSNLQILSLKPRQAVYAGLFTIFITLAYGYFLSSIHNAMPFISAFSTASSALGATFAGKKIKQQFVFWICNNIALVIMWFSSLHGGTLQLPILIVNIIFIIINIRGQLNWNRVYRIQEIK